MRRCLLLLLIVIASASEASGVKNRDVAQLASRSSGAPSSIGLSLLNSGRDPGQDFLRAPVPKMPETEHTKTKGHGYKEGSPLYDKTQDTGGKLPEQDAKANKPKKEEVPKEEKVDKVERPADKEAELPDVPTVEDAKVSEDHFDVSMTPVSTTMKCIINLCVQYFVVYALFLIVRSCQVITDARQDSEPSVLLKTLDACQSTVNYAPMLCVLFLATRLRAIQLTQGHTERYGLPQVWTQFAMYVCTSAVFGQLVFLLLMTCISGQAPSTDSDGNLDPPRTGGRCMLMFVQIVRFFLMACLYGGFAVVCVGLCTMQAPKEVYPDGPPAVSATVQCIITLSVQYFAIYLILAILRTYNQINGQSRTRASDLFQIAAYTVNFAPMLCILFALARMRALQLDPKWGKPQDWAEACFWLCTCSINLQTLLVLLVPTLFGGQVSPGTSEGDIRYKFKSVNLRNVFFVIRCILFIGLYAGFTAILASVCLIENTNGEATPPISPAMQCVILLACFFFSVYLLLSIANIANGLSSSASGDGRDDRTPRTPSGFAVAMLESARRAVNLCPMLSILFLGLRMRAMQITQNRGAPQGWAQDCMYVCVCATFVQLLIMLVVPLCSGYAVQSTPQSLTPRPKGKLANRIVEVLCLICIAVVYAASFGVMVAVFTMTVENATGRGAQLPVPDNVDRRRVDTKLA